MRTDFKPPPPSHALVLTLPSSTILMALHVLLFLSAASATAGTAASQDWRASSSSALSSCLQQYSCRSLPVACRCHSKTSVRHRRHDCKLTGPDCSHFKFPLVRLAEAQLSSQHSHRIHHFACTPQLLVRGDIYSRLSQGAHRLHKKSNHRAPILPTADLSARYISRRSVFHSLQRQPSRLDHSPSSSHGRLQTACDGRVQAACKGTLLRRLRDLCRLEKDGHGYALDYGDGHTQSGTPIDVA